MHRKDVENTEVDPMNAPNRTVFFKKDKASQGELEENFKLKSQTSTKTT